MVAFRDVVVPFSRGEGQTRRTFLPCDVREWSVVEYDRGQTTSGNALQPAFEGAPLALCVNTPDALLFGSRVGVSRVRAGESVRVHDRCLFGT